MLTFGAIKRNRWRVSTQKTLSNWLYFNKKSKIWLAKQLGVNRASIHYWLRGARNPSKKMIIKIAEITKGEINALEKIKEWHRGDEKKKKARKAVKKVVRNSDSRGCPDDDTLPV